MIPADVAGQVCVQHCGATRLSGEGFCWLGLLNVLMLVAFLAAALRHDRADESAGQSPADGAPASRPDHRRPRASDADREATAATVRRAMAEGRLTLDEGVDRLDAAFAAGRRDELGDLVADLPSEPEGRPDRWPRVARDLRDFAMLAVVAAAVAQAAAGLWILWPIAVAALAPLALVGRHPRGAREGALGGGSQPLGRGQSGVEGSPPVEDRRLPPV